MFKTVVIISGIVIVVAILVVYLLLNKEEPETFKDVVPENVQEFLNDEEQRKLENVILTGEQFKLIVPPEGFIVYYFPSECPSYTEDILVYEETKHGEKYYLPQQHSLLKLPIEHKWTQEFKGGWISWINENKSEQSEHQSKATNEQSEQSKATSEQSEQSKATSEQSKATSEQSEHQSKATNESEATNEATNESEATNEATNESEATNERSQSVNV